MPAIRICGINIIRAGTYFQPHTLKHWTQRSIQAIRLSHISDISRHFQN